MQKEKNLILKFRIKVNLGSPNVQNSSMIVTDTIDTKSGQCDRTNTINPAVKLGSVIFVVRFHANSRFLL